MREAGDETTELRAQVEALQLRVAQLERSDAIYRKAIEASSDITLRCGVDAICTYASPAITEVLGYTPEDFVGRHCLSILHPDDLDLPRELRDRLAVGSPSLANDRLGPFLSRLRHDQGHYVWIENMVAIVRDPDTNLPREYVMTIRDVNARVEAEAALRASEERSKLMLDNLQVGVVVQGARSEMLAYNVIALDMLGLTAEQIKGRDSFDPRWAVIHEDGSPFPGGEHPVSVAVTTGKPVRDVIMGVYRPASESRVWLLVSATPQFDATGRAYQSVCTFTDITAQKQAEVLIREQKDLLERMSSPTIPIAAGVVVLPLIGQFDAGRAERILDGVLNGVTLHGARVVILDITGVSAADAGFAGSLLQISRAVRLLGAQVVVTGITAAIAQILVDLNIDLNSLVTRGTLQDGVAFALAR